RLISIWSHIPERSMPHLELTLAEYEAIRARSRTLEDVALFSAANFAVIANVPEPVNVTSNFVSKSFAPLLGVRALHGRTFAESEHAANAPKVAMISHRLFTTLYGGNPKIVGTPIDLEGDKYTIVGVLPPDVSVPRDADLLIAIEPLYAGAPDDALDNSVFEGI